MAGPLRQDPAVSWEIALDRLEVDLVLAERLLRTLQTPADLDAWEQPALSGSIPSHLLPRARQLAARQEKLLDELGQAMERSRRQRELANRVGHATTGPARPIYIDATA